MSSDRLSVEVPFGDSGTMLGADVNGFGTYASTVPSDGSMYAEGNGACLSAEGEATTWNGSGREAFTAGGGVGYRGILYYRSISPKFARLDTVAAVFEYHVDRAA